MATVSNTIFWENSASTDVGPEIWIGDDPSYSTLDIDYSDVKGGQSSVYLDPDCFLNWGMNMIETDPLFVDEAAADYHLTFNSPCKDTGDNSVVSELNDFENDPRIVYGTVDMGADEFYNHMYCTGDFTPDSAIEGKFIGLPATWPIGLFIGSGIMKVIYILIQMTIIYIAF